MRWSFFKTHKPKQFRYKPRHFDEEKERREQRKADMGLGSAGDLKFKHRMHSSWKYQREQDRQRRKSANYGTLIILAVLFLIAYYLFFR